MNIRGTLTVTAASAVLALGLTGCSNDGSTSAATPLPSSPSVAAAATSTSPQQASSSAGNGTSTGANTSKASTGASGRTATSSTGPSRTGGTASQSASTVGTPSSGPSTSSTGCATQTAAQAAKKAMQTVPQFSGWAWVVRPTDNHFDRCADLSYIVLGIDGTASSPYQIALYHRGSYLGTATKEAYGFHPVVTRTAGNAIRVQYLFTKGNGCTACATGHAVATFRWDDASQKIVMTGNVPPVAHD